ncbi:putative oxidoreductase [Oceanicola granulosus HTCC2516]|uniref:Putative oxidoreductase n=1 Tax=Oceanicola granulosus (strain ATCC BAA-861 / DSM 15982 / KCTC 12143 / HTCC2516) TaxID=314256 RepID=Q2CFE8_OCEGH|nr:aldo/keto reductase [Oceanicola granulosus]EAR51347.1 putative oxidoreductase [Oceanicola granulosus HTCC2516]
MTIGTKVNKRLPYPIPDLCFGTSPLGDMPDTYGYGVDAERAQATVQAIFDQSPSFLDTARIYGHGRSEERIGQVIRERGGLPEGVLVSTKLDRHFETGRFDGAQARRSLEQSLEALGLDKVHMLHLHDPEHAADLDEITRHGGALDELFRMKEEGLTDAVGLAMGEVELTRRLLAEREYDTLINHNRFTLLNRNADTLYDEAHARGVAIFNAAPYASGILAKGSANSPRITYQEASEDQLAPVRAIEEVCARHGVQIGVAALQFSMRDPRITSTMVGVSRPERVQQTCDWAAQEVPEALWEELAALPYDTSDPEAERVYKPG